MEIKIYKTFEIAEDQSVTLRLEQAKQQGAGRAM